MVNSANDPEPLIVQTRWYGQIIDDARGEHGFGYDPVFIPEGFEVTAAQLEPEVKNSMSHRTLALEQLASYLNAN